MVYNNKFVAVVKCNGRVLRERGDLVTLPFGSEYSLLLKNLESRRCSVNITIDGQDVLDGYSLVLEPNSETELQGFLRGSTVRNRFKFIQKTKQIQDHRGDRVDDGMIRIEYAFEVRKPEVRKKTIITERKERRRRYYYDYNPPLFDKDWGWEDSGNIYGASTHRLIGSSSDTFTCNSSDSPKMSRDMNVSNFCYQSDICEDSLDDAPMEDEGITVQGSQTYQGFHSTTLGALDPAETIIIRLRGTKSTGAKVTTPLTVKTKLTCPTCGKRSGSSARFCAQCGTNLEV